METRNIKDLKNPSEAFKSIASVQKQFRAKCCLAPDTTSCSGNIISAHTLSAQAMLRPISRNGLVYTPRVDFYATSEDEIISIKEVGIRDTSTFNGFCAYHDKKLFTEIEDIPFVCSQKQIFTHAFRAVAKETFLKRAQADTAPNAEMIKKIHGISDSEYIPNPQVFLNELGSSVGANELENFKKRLDQIYLKEDWSRLITTVIEFGKVPSVVCSAPYSPDYDFGGNMLQDFSDLEKELENLIVTVFPTNSGGFALFSYIDTASGVCAKMVDSILSQKNLTTALIWFIFGQFENIAISPVWFEGQTPEIKLKLKRHLQFSADPTNNQASQLHLCPDYLDDWNPIRVFKI